MRRIAIINQKGGVGKTTTTVNVGMALARAGHRVLLIDLDPQAHLTLYLGLDPQSDREGTYELLTGSATISKARRKIATNLWAVGARIDLAATEVELVSVVGREVILRDLLNQHVGHGVNGRTAQYDYVLMDCPPSLNVLTLNGLCAAREVVIPLQPHYLGLQGLSKLLETVSLVSQRINPGLSVTGVVICMHESGTRLAGEVLDDVRAFLDAARGTPVPWANARLFETMIRRNIKLAESPSYGQSIFDYAPDSNGARDYEQLAREIDGAPDETLGEPAVAGAEAVVPSQNVPIPAEPATMAENPREVETASTDHEQDAADTSEASEALSGDAQDPVPAASTHASRGTADPRPPAAASARAPARTSA